MTELTWERKESRFVLHGDLDVDSIQAFHRAASIYLADHSKIEINLHNVSYLDSSGLSVLVALMKEAIKRGLTKEAVVILHPPPHVKRVLSITGLDNILTIRKES